VDVRIVAATHQNLEDLVAQRTFREDLFHRLNVIRIHLPSLAERREDIPLLMNHFLQLAAGELGCAPKRLLPEAEERLREFSWPGNVRQLENTARWLMVMASGQEIHAEDLPPELAEHDDAGRTEQGTGDWRQALRHWARHALHEGREDLLSEAAPSFERALLETALEYTGGRKLEAAKLLGWGRNTLTRKLKELGIADID
jgi:two-component system nitrogen regulation response regulator GlnG